MSRASLLYERISRLLEASVNRAETHILNPDRSLCIITASKGPDFFAAEYQDLKDRQDNNRIREIQKYNAGLKSKFKPPMKSMLADTAQRNNERRKLLIKDIVDAGYKGYFPLQGHYLEEGMPKSLDVPEKSLFVIDTLDDPAKFKQVFTKLGGEYDQECILYKGLGTKCYWLFTSDCTDYQNIPRHVGDMKYLGDKVIKKVEELLEYEPAFSTIKGQTMLVGGADSKKEYKRKTS